MIHSIIDHQKTAKKIHHQWPYLLWIYSQIQTYLKTHANHMSYREKKYYRIYLRIFLYIFSKDFSPSSVVASALNVILGPVLLALTSAHPFK